MRLKLIFCLLAAALLMSCSNTKQSFSKGIVQKRKLTKGYHVDLGFKKKNQKSKVLTAQIEQRDTLELKKKVVFQEADESRIAKSEVEKVKRAKDPFKEFKVDWARVKSKKEESDDSPLLAHKEEEATLVIYAQKRKNRLARRFENFQSQAIGSEEEAKTHWGAIAGFSCALLGILGVVVGALGFGTVLGLAATMFVIGFLGSLTFGLISLAAINKDSEKYKGLELTMATLVISYVLSVIFFIGLLVLIALWAAPDDY